MAIFYRRLLAGIYLAGAALLAASLVMDYLMEKSLGSPATVFLNAFPIPLFLGLMSVGLFVRSKVKRIEASRRVSDYFW